MNNPCEDCLCKDSGQCSCGRLDKYELYINTYNQALEDLVGLVCEYYTMQERAGYCADTNNMIKQNVADFAEQLKR